MLEARGFTYGLAIGAGSMFLLDPQRGAARRARLRDTSRRVVHDAQRFMRIASRDLENRAHGVGARANGMLRRDEDDLAEDVIIARVRSRLGRVTSHAHAIEVKLKEGNEIELKGPALASEHDKIVRAAARVRGVDHIDDDLVVYEHADGVPGLQGDGGERGKGGVRIRLSPAGELLVGAAIATALVSPLAPTLVRGVAYGITRSLMRDAVPVATRRIAARFRAAPARSQPASQEARSQPEG